MAITAKTIKVGPEDMYMVQQGLEACIPLDEEREWNPEDLVTITDGWESAFVEILVVLEEDEALVCIKKTHVWVVRDLDPIMRLRQDGVVDIDITPFAFVRNEVVLLVHEASGQHAAAVVLVLRYPTFGRTVVSLEKYDCDPNCLSFVLAGAQAKAK